MAYTHRNTSIGEYLVATLLVLVGVGVVIAATMYLLGIDSNIRAIGAVVTAGQFLFQSFHIGAFLIAVYFFVASALVSLERSTRSLMFELVAFSLPILTFSLGMRLLFESSGDTSPIVIWTIDIFGRRLGLLISFLLTMAILITILQFRGKIATQGARNDYGTPEKRRGTSPRAAFSPSRRHDHESPRRHKLTHRARASRDKTPSTPPLTIPPPWQWSTFIYSGGKFYDSPSQRHDHSTHEYRDAVRANAHTAATHVGMEAGGHNNVATIATHTDMNADTTEAAIADTTETAIADTMETATGTAIAAMVAEVSAAEAAGTAIATGTATETATAEETETATRTATADTMYDGAPHADTTETAARTATRTAIADIPHDGATHDGSTPSTRNPNRSGNASGAPDAFGRSGDASGAPDTFAQSGNAPANASSRSDNAPTNTPTATPTPPRASTATPAATAIASAATAISPATVMSPAASLDAPQSGWYLDPDTLLTHHPHSTSQEMRDHTERTAKKLQETLREFNIEAKIVGIRRGPVVTVYELLPARGVKLTKISSLADNIALSLAAPRVRIVAPIPGKRAVGIELPNHQRQIVGFDTLVSHEYFQDADNNLPIALGKGVSGEAQIIDLTTTPHLLIAGATGSGKSVCVNAIISSLLFRCSPEQVRMLLIDPKIVELKLYNNIPHLIAPVVTDTREALAALNYCIVEMENRYRLLDQFGVRDIGGYNRAVQAASASTQGRPTPEADADAPQAMPYLVVIIDEFADLMITGGKQLEITVSRLTAMSRAVGIHLILATQRPSADVITGLIKANIPTRIAFMVPSKIDSRIILDTGGAERLLGQGDMLFVSSWEPTPVRIQGALITDEEVGRITAAAREYGAPAYINITTQLANQIDNDGSDPLYDEALEIVRESDKASASYLQRRLQIGYNRAARIIEEMEERGVVGPANGSKARELL